jgi:ferredoxin
MPEMPVLNVDRIACDGRGICAELLPELIELDDWGYPIVRSAEVPPDLLGHAPRAVVACPVLAFRLFDSPRPPPSRGDTRG